MSKIVWRCSDNLARKTKSSRKVEEVFWQNYFISILSPKFIGIFRESYVLGKYSKNYSETSWKLPAFESPRIFVGHVNIKSFWEEACYTCFRTISTRLRRWTMSEIFNSSPLIVTAWRRSISVIGVRHLTHNSSCGHRWVLGNFWVCQKKTHWKSCSNLCCFGFGGKIEIVCFRATL